MKPSLSPEQFSTFAVMANGITYNLLDYVNYVVHGSDGFGLPKVERFEEVRPNQDGATDIGYRLLPRELRFDIRTQGATKAAYFQRRRTLFSIFNPDYPALLKLATPDAPTTYYYLNCQVVDGLKNEGNKRNGLVQDADVVLRAADPCFYMAQVSQVVNITATSLSTYLTYTGNYPAPLRIVVTGPVANPVITLGESGDYPTVVTIDRTLASSSPVLEIDTGERTVEYNNASSIASYDFDNSADLALVRLPPRMACMSTNGVELTIECDSYTSGANIAFYHYPRLIGL